MIAPEIENLYQHHVILHLVHNRDDLSKLFMNAQQRKFYQLKVILHLRLIRFKTDLEQRRGGEK